MGTTLLRLSICSAAIFGLAIQGSTLFADQASWEHDMDVALQAAARQDFASSESSFVSAIKELELMNSSDPRLGPTINSLGLVYRAQNKLPQAETAFRQAMSYIERSNSPDSIDVGNSNLNVGSVLVSQGKYNQAEPFLQKALRIYRKQLGETSPKTAAVLQQLGETYRNLHDYSQAETTLRKALDIQETARGIDDPDVATTVSSIAELYASQNLNEKAEPMFKLVMSIRESTAGMDSPEFGAAVERYAQILDKMGRTKEAERHRKLALAVKAMKKPALVPVKSHRSIDTAPPTPDTGVTPPTAKNNSFARMQ